MSEHTLHADNISESSSQFDEASLNNKHRISSEPADSQAESQQSTASIDQELRCGICLETLTAPYTIIPCLHTFDRLCLVEWWKVNSNCPTCKKTSTSAKSAFQLNAIMDHVHKNRRKRRKISATSEAPASNEIFPLSGGHAASDYYDDDDDEPGENPDFESIEDGDGLIWPCAACVPNNLIGYTCPTPLPSPTPAEIQTQQARRPAWAPVGPPLRGHARMSLDSAIEMGIPGAADHSICVGCGTYVPLGFPRAIKCGGCSEVHCNNFDPAGCPSASSFRPRHDVKLTPYTAGDASALTPFLPNLVRENRHEVSRLIDYVAARNMSQTDVLVALFGVKRNQVAEDTNEQDADENWGSNAWFCGRCVLFVTQSTLFRWWVDERRASLERQDGIIVRKPDCWYGRECRTQTHNDSHAERHNHICENTRHPDA